MPEFILQHARGTVREVRAERVGADQFREVAAEVCACWIVWPHFVEGYFYSALSGLPGGFTSSQSAAYDGELSHGKYFTIRGFEGLGN